MPTVKICSTCGIENPSGYNACWSCKGESFGEFATRDIIPLLSIDYVPSREIALAIGTVVGHGDAWFGTTRQRVAQAKEEAVADIRGKALRVGADAVVGLRVTVSGVRGFWGILTFFGQSAVVLATGTAVKLNAKEVEIPGEEV